MRNLLTNRFTGKAPLKAYIDSQSDGIGRNIQLARDRDETGKKTYHYVPVDAVDKLCELLTTNTHLYQLIPPDVPVKPFFDLEMERVGMKMEDANTEGKALLSDFIDEVVAFINHEYGIQLDANDFITLSACREGKISYHLIVKNKICFESMVALKQFILKFQTTIQNIEKFVWSSHQDKH